MEEVELHKCAKFQNCRSNGSEVTTINVGDELNEQLSEEMVRW